MLYGINPRYICITKFKHFPANTTHNKQSSLTLIKDGFYSLNRNDVDKKTHNNKSELFHFYNGWYVGL